jgi:hypothetical protein
MDADLEGRISALETRAARIRPATEGADGWANFVESRVLEESEFLRGVMAHAMAMFRDDILNQCKAAITEALSQRIRGTFDGKASYSAHDVVAHDGASFIARKDNPGGCPSEGWQLMARQGQRGIAGPKGPPGKDAPVIQKWLVNRGDFTVTPIFSDGRFGPVLNLQELFAPSQADEATR